MHLLHNCTPRTSRLTVTAPDTTKTSVSPSPTHQLAFVGRGIFRRDWIILQFGPLMKMESEKPSYLSGHNLSLTTMKAPWECLTMAKKNKKKPEFHKLQTNAVNPPDGPCSLTEAPAWQQVVTKPTRSSRENESQRWWTNTCSKSPRITGFLLPTFLPSYADIMSLWYDVTSCIPKHQK